MTEYIADLDSNCNSSYYMKVRKFSSGRLHVVTRPVRAMQQAAFAYSYSHPFRRAVPRVIEMTDEERQSKDQENHTRAVRRSKQRIGFLVQEMQGDRLLTLTYRENVQDREKVKGDFKRFLRLLRASLKRQWVYVAVLERQTRGAFHIHCAVKGWQEISVIRRCWYQALGGTGFEVKEDAPGQVDVTNPKTSRDGKSGRSWRSARLAGYITKYLEKTFEDFQDSEKKRYWHSADLKVPDAELVWLGGCELPQDAIFSTVSALKTFYGLQGAQFDMWLSPDLTVFYVGGQGGT